MKEKREKAIDDAWGEEEVEVEGGGEMWECDYKRCVFLVLLVLKS